MLGIWRDHFNQLLIGDEVYDPANESSSSPFGDEVNVAITRLKSKKTTDDDGLQTELFKNSGADLVNQLVIKIRSEESMSDGWNLSTIISFHKKGDRLLCTNYKSISLLNIAYKIFSSVLCERLQTNWLTITSVASGLENRPSTKSSSLENTTSIHTIFSSILKQHMIV